MPYAMCFIDFRVTEEGLVGTTDPTLGWQIANWTIDISFILDLVAQFFFSFQDNRGRLISHPKKIAEAYLKGWFLFDFIACLPPQLFSLALGAGNSNMNKVARLPRLYRIGRLARLARILRLSHLLRTFRSNPFVAAVQRCVGNSRAASVTKLALVLLLLAHLLGCLWYLVAALNNNPVEDTWLSRRDRLLSKSAFSHWINSVYFVLTVFTTVGFGDISAGTASEAVVGLILMLMGAIINSIIVSEVIAVVTRVDGANAEMRSKKQAIQSYSNQVDLRDSKLEERCLKFAEFSTIAKYADRAAKHKQDFDWRSLWDVIHNMPFDMKVDLMQRVFDGVLHQNRFFRISNQDAISLALFTSQHLSQCFFTPGQTVYSLGDQPTGLFLIQSGVLSPVAVPTESGGVSDAFFFLGNFAESEDPEFVDCPYMLCGKGNFIGEWELINPHPRVSTVQAEKKSSCLFLSQKAFIILVMTFPKFLDSFKRYARRREERRRIYISKHKKVCTVESLAATSIQRVWKGILARRLVLQKAQIKFRQAARKAKTICRMTKVFTSADFTPGVQLQFNGTGIMDDLEGRKSRPISPEVEGLPPYAADLQEDMERVQSHMDLVKKGQAEIRRMLQQLYFLKMS